MDAILFIALFLVTVMLLMAADRYDETHDHDKLIRHMKHQQGPRHV